MHITGFKKYFLRKHCVSFEEVGQKTSFTGVQLTCKTSGSATGYYLR